MYQLVYDMDRASGENITEPHSHGYEGGWLGEEFPTETEAMAAFEQECSKGNWAFFQVALVDLNTNLVIAAAAMDHGKVEYF